MIQKIVVGTDTSAAADMAVSEAAELALAHDAELVVLYVRPPIDAREVFDPGKLPDPAGYLERIAGRFTDVKTRTRIEAGDPAETICDVAHEEGADTIVVGNRGAQGSWWRVRDSVPNIVVRHAPCSVLIVDTRKAQ
jgi:nucleotide-binding universal stress UspA family protein